MSVKKIIVFLLVFFIIVLFSILLVINNLTKANKKNENNIEDEIQNEQLNNNEVNVNENTVEDTNNIDYNNSDYVFYHEQENGKAQYNREHLNVFEFDIDNIPSEVLKYIDNIDEFKNKFKEFIYLNGLIDASIATYKELEVLEEDHCAWILYTLNNEKQTNIDVTINLENHNISFGARL